MIYFCHLVGFRAQIQARAYPPQQERPAQTPRSGQHRPPCHPARSESPCHPARSESLATLPDPRNCAAARRRTGPARRPARLQTARHGVASADSLADGPGCCAPDTAPGTAWPAARRRTGPARRPACLQTARSGVATADGPADGLGCCRSAAARTLRPGWRGPARCAAAPRNTSGQWTNRLPQSI